MSKQLGRYLLATFFFSFCGIGTTENKKLPLLRVFSGFRLHAFTLLNSFGSPITYIYLMICIY